MKRKGLARVIIIGGFFVFVTGIWLYLQRDVGNSLAKSDTVSIQERDKSHSENSKPSEVASITSTGVNEARIERIPAQEGEALPPAEEVAFFAEVKSFFTTGYQVLNEESRDKALMDLNSRLEKGVQSCFNALRKNPSDTDVYQDRRTLVDYLSYRAKWDPQVRARIIEYTLENLHEVKPVNVRAMKMAENIELMKALARHDREAALSLMGSLDSKDTVYRRYAAVYIQTGLIESGLSEAESKQLIRKYYPDFDQQNG